MKTNVVDLAVRCAICAIGIGVWAIIVAASNTTWAKEKKQDKSTCEKNLDKCVAACTTHFNKYERYYCILHCDQVYIDCIAINPPTDGKTPKRPQPKNQQSPGNVQVPPKLPPRVGAGTPPNGGILNQGSPGFTPSRPSAIGTRAPN